MAYHYSDIIEKQWLLRVKSYYYYEQESHRSEHLHSNIKMYDK